MFNTSLVSTKVSLILIILLDQWASLFGVGIELDFMNTVSI